MTKVRHPAEKALLPFTLAEDLDPQICVAYEALLLSRESHDSPAIQYRLHCNKLDWAIATKSNERANEAFAGFLELTQHPEYDLRRKAFALARKALAYEGPMRHRVSRSSIPYAVRLSTYHATANIMQDVLAHPEIGEGAEAGYIGEGLIFGALLRKNRGPIPHFSLWREESNPCYGSQNHDFYIKKPGDMHKQPWQIKMSRFTSTPSTPPVKDIYVLPLIARLLRKSKDLKRETDSGIVSGYELHVARWRYMADLMIKETQDDITPKQGGLLNTFSGLVTRYMENN